MKSTHKKIPSGRFLLLFILLLVSVWLLLRWDRIEAFFGMLFGHQS